jgi:hypothetical protein
MNHTTQRTPAPRPTNARKRSRRKRLPSRLALQLELLETRCLLDAGIRPITEVGNNLANPNLGATGTDLLRLSPVGYTDGTNSPSLATDPSARVVSDLVSNQADPANLSQDIATVEQGSLSDFGYVWGQFIDHDMDLTTTASGQLDNILADPNDPSQMGTQTFVRSTFDPNTGTAPGTPISIGLSPSFNRTGIVNDGSTFSGGLDGGGNALSANLLGSSVTFGGATYALGAAGVSDVVSVTGQTVSLQTINPNQLNVNASSLSFLATGVNGNQANQTFKVTYTDGTSQTFTQSISDWFTPQHYSGESIAVTMPYRDRSNGTRDSRTFDVYAYSFALNPLKQVQSITLPNDANVEVLAIDLTPAPLSVNVSGTVNRTGIVRDGSTFSGGGLDGGGNALSANLLGSTVTFGGATYAIGAAGVNDVISAGGQTISLPSTNAASLSFLATGVNGNQANQTFKVTYTDGTSQTFTQSISDWFTPQHYSGESIAVTMPYRDRSNGTRDSRTFDVYAYSLTLDPTRVVQSITLPSDGNVEVLAIDVTATNPRQQVNAITSFLDLSQVYGSTQTVANALRTFSGGQLQTSPGNMLPFNNTTYFTVQQLAALNMANDAQAAPSTALFATGDLRGNENVELTALQTLFVRNHNRLAAELQQEHPTWTDEQLYQEARKLNIATEQMITYNSYLPDVLGANAIPAYSGYNPNVDPAIATEFSTVAFRFGHSLLSGNIERHDNNGNDIPGDPTGGAAINLAQDFFDPYLLNPNGVIDPLTGHISSDIDAILKGDADGDSQDMDALAIREVRNLLFANGGLQDNGQDLIARDIQRGRDDGIGTYNQVRVAFGLAPVTSFAQITSNVTLQNELQQAYGTVANIDPFVGGIAEDHVPGSNVGPLFQAILVDQFTRLRDGDRFFYLNESFNQDELNLLNQAPTLAGVIEANTGVTNLQADVFKFRASISGTVFLDLDDDGGTQTSSEPGLRGVTLQLQDTSGDVLATTTTDRNGNYRFNQLSGPAANPDIASGISATGDYVIVLVLSPGLVQTTGNPGPIHISRGGINVNGVNFGVDFSFLASSIGGSSTSGSSGQSGSPVVELALPGTAPTGSIPNDPDLSSAGTIREQQSHPGDPECAESGGASDQRDAEPGRIPEWEYPGWGDLGQLAQRDDHRSAVVLDLVSPGPCSADCSIGASSPGVYTPGLEAAAARPSIFPNLSSFPDHSLIPWQSSFPRQPINWSEALSFPIPCWRSTYASGQPSHLPPLERPSPAGISSQRCPVARAGMCAAGPVG